MDEKLSRRKVLSFSLLGAAFGLLAPTALTVSDVEAQTPPPSRRERRQERRAARRAVEPGTGRLRVQPSYFRERHDPTLTN